MIPPSGTSMPFPVVHRASALRVYRDHIRNGRRYSIPAYVLGALLRHRFASAGAVAWLRGSPVPAIDQGGGEIHVGHVGLYSGVQLRCALDGVIRIGDGTVLNRNTLVYSEQDVSIGRDVMIGWDVIITDTAGFGERPSAFSAGRTSAGASVGHVQPVHIGDHAWIGAKAVIVAGARIGAGAMVAAGAVVDYEVEAGSTVTAHAARKIFDLGRADHV